jgi:hypothetical protein
LLRWFVGSSNSKRSRGASKSERAGKGRGERLRFTMGHNGEGIRVTRRLQVVGGAHGRKNPQRSQNPWVAAVQTEAAGSWH